MNYGGLISNEEREERKKQNEERLDRLGRLPDELKQLRVFCLFDPVREGDRVVKKPCNPCTNKYITRDNCTDPDVYCSFSEIRGAARRESRDIGIGLIYGLAAIELDQCYDDGGKMSKAAEAVIKMMDCYTEITPGGSGIRLIFKLPPGFTVDESSYDTSNPEIGLEIYVEGYTGKCATVTGEALSRGVGLEERGGQLQEVMELFLQKRKKAKPMEVLIPPSELPVPACSPLSLTLGRSADQLTVHTGSGDKKLSGLHLEKRRHGQYGWNPVGMARLFADTYKDIVRYSPERRCWFVYNAGKGVWEPDNGMAMELAKEFVEALLRYARSLPVPADGDDKNPNREFFTYMLKLHGRTAREGLLKDAESIHRIKISQLDANPNIFNCLNGTLDLGTGDFHPHTPADLLGRVANVRYDPDAECGRWERFMDEVTDGDAERKKYLQKLFGYSLTGNTRMECIYILYGPAGRNGKSTFLEVAKTILGEYARTADSATLAQKQYQGGSGPSEDLARLAGARLVALSESEKGMPLKASLLKSLTGNDTITARYLRENSIEFRPTFKLVMATNHLPRVSDLTVFKTSRMKIIPFNHEFKGSGQDKNLKWELMRPENLSGILNWAIGGLRLIEKEGFEEPESVRLAAADYEKESDKVGRYIEDRLVAKPFGEVRTEDVYRDYREWCGRVGQCAESSEMFKKALESHNVEVKRTRPRGTGTGANPLWLIRGYELNPFREIRPPMGMGNPPGNF